MRGTKERHTCKRCNKHPARFKDASGRVKADRDHDLCSRCMDSQREQDRAWKLVPHYGVV
jgi:hypothetical protein